MNKINSIYHKALDSIDLNFAECMELYTKADQTELMLIANHIRNKIHNNKIVGWIIDRNINITNVCISQCKFCNYFRKPDSLEAQITSFEEYEQKITQLFELGGSQILLQGGLHPKLGIDFYCDLFIKLKNRFPSLKLHALGPPEIIHISRISGIDVETTLNKLIAAGLDSLPGAGAEILSDRVRKIVSPNKCMAEDWLKVMRIAHKMNIVTSATMMFGHVETPEERIEHLIKIRDLQAEKNESSTGFISFIPWIFKDEKTILAEKFNVSNTATKSEYIRLIAVCRIILHNIKNIQASWLTTGKEAGQLCLSSGANDFGSIMIEENVVSSAGARHKMNQEEMIASIKQAGFVPKLRNQKFEYMDESPS